MQRKYSFVCVKSSQTFCTCGQILVQSEKIQKIIILINRLADQVTSNNSTRQGFQNIHFINSLIAPPYVKKFFFSFFFFVCEKLLSFYTYGCILLLRKGLEDGNNIKFRFFMVHSLPFHPQIETKTELTLLFKPFINALALSSLS